MKDIFEKVKENLEIAYQKSSFWRDFFKEKGIDVYQINSVEEYTRNMPIIDSPGLMRVIEKGLQKGFGYYYLSSTEKICAIGQTGGTIRKDTPEGISLIVPYSNDFWEKMIERAITFYKEQLKLEEKDKVGILYDLGLQPAGQFHIYALRKSGFSVFPIGTEYPIYRVIKLIIDLRLNVLFTSPQIAYLIVKTAIKEKIPSELFKIKKIMTSSSKLTPIVRESLVKFWDAEVIQVSGATELLLFATECTYRNGLHLDMSNFFFEFVNPITPIYFSEEDKLNARSEEEKLNIKSLVVTTLENRGFHLFRYRLGDVVKVNFSDCECGNNLPRIEFIGREGLFWDLISGIKIYDYQIRNALSTVKEFTGNYKLHKPEDADILNFEVEVSSLNDRLEQKIKEKLENMFPEFSDKVAKGLIKVNVKIVTFQKKEER